MNVSCRDGQNEYSCLSSFSSELLTVFCVYEFAPVTLKSLIFGGLTISFSYLFSDFSRSYYNYLVSKIPTVRYTVFDLFNNLRCCCLE